MLVLAIGLAIIVLLVLGSWEVGWFAPQSGASLPTVGHSPNAATINCSAQVVGNGSLLVQPLMDAWSSSYHSVNASWPAPIYRADGSGDGIVGISAKQLDFGASDTPLTTEEAGSDPGIITLPESADALSVIYDLPGVALPLNFNASVLAQIYLGEMTNWNSSPLVALNPGVKIPSEQIQPMVNSLGGGDNLAWSSYLSTGSSAWASAYGRSPVLDPPGARSVSGDSRIASFVSANPYTIGYVDFSDTVIPGWPSNVQTGDLETPTGSFVPPSLVTTTDALEGATAALPAPAGNWYNVSMLDSGGSDDYPLVFLTYVFVYGTLSTSLGGIFGHYSLTNASSLVNWLRYVVTVGQNASASDGFIDLSNALVKYDVGAIDSMTWDGKAIPYCTAQ